MKAYPEEKIRGPGCWFSLALSVCIVWFGCCCLLKPYISVLSGEKQKAKAREKFVCCSEITLLCSVLSVQLTI